MDDWLQTAARPAVLVTVARVEGSVPREAGARMLVDAARQWDTIGGGHLELRAVEIARAMLASGEARRLERFPLGPSLGQCCGGVAHLAFEHADGAHLAALAARRHADTWRLVAFDGAPDLALCDGDGKPLAGPGPAFDRAAATHLLRDAEGRRWLADLVAAPRARVMLFGAGHVGAAIVRALAGLPCRVTWVDERDAMFPANLPHNVTVEATDAPEALAQHAAPGTFFLVMTHSHALDQRLAETILKRPTDDWFGLIGSDTKRKQFERRLLERGVDGARLDAMVCPVGVPGIDGKQPAVIAVAVAAQLLMAWERAFAPGPGHALPERS
ncbi:xanthine dehydrogenase accessory protein XdhC [Massilia sp. TN1-12]|uniref:xanthine dehydrogenase accessory protein XdhC n=1 Tax=Massilia paldalensis TaxID=3377675 RepID=UPI00384C7CCF